MLPNIKSKAMHWNVTQIWLWLSHCRISSKVNSCKNKRPDVALSDALFLHSPGGTTKSSLWHHKGPDFSPSVCFDQRISETCGNRKRASDGFFPVATEIMWLNHTACDWRDVLSPLSRRPLRCDPVGLPLLPSTGLPVGHSQGVWPLLLVAVLVPVLLWPQQPAVRPRHQPTMWPVWLPGSPLLLVWLPHVWHLPPGHWVPGPRHGNLSDALPLTLSRIKKIRKEKNRRTKSDRNFFFYLLKSSGKRATLHKQDTRFAVNSP